MEKIRVGIGFATGRKNFRQVLSTYIYNWKECGLVETERVSLNLFVVYDLEYNSAKPVDFTAISETLREMLDGIHVINKELSPWEIKETAAQNAISAAEADTLFGSGYAAMRNIILYGAIKHKMDYLLYLDDDDYPLAVTKTGASCIWSGQHILKLHLRNIQDADITAGLHCGYISPIPSISFNNTLKEDEFRLFIEAISNDIINWESVRAVMNNGGITYADTDILKNSRVEEVPEILNTKFISGSNLCINLTKPERVYPFYNPPGARGEDTFLSACLGERRVLRLPCYTFHDGFARYNHMLHGVLPINLKPVTPDTKQILSRFYRACVGWVRYKPLLLYITQKESYQERIAEMKSNLSAVLPKLCAYFNNPDFMTIAKELEFYDRQVREHYAQFTSNQTNWQTMLESLQE